MSLQGKRVLVTGGHGFLGRHVIAELRRQDATAFLTSRIHDLSSESLTNEEFGYWRSEGIKFDILIHLAAACGGIGANAKQPAHYLYRNAMMAMNVMHQAYHAGVKKFVGIGSVCMYPKHCPVPFREYDIWNGYPEETNAPYGIAKRLLLEMAQAYRKQYGFNAITLIPANLYGPGDNFDLETSHVIPALIRKAVEAKESGKPLEVWGNLKATREFLHVRDAARAIVLAAADYNEAEPVNIGTGRESSIASVLETIVRAVDYFGDYRTANRELNGQPRRCLDVSRAKAFGFEAQISLEDGIRETVDWYKANRCEVAV
jgi:GDP-L-fucose synthase